MAEQNLKRNQNLIAVNAVSQQALQETESQAAVAKAQVESIAAQIQETESNLKASRTNLSYTKIYAPMAGTVTTLPTKEGQTSERQSDRADCFAGGQSRYHDRARPGRRSGREPPQREYAGLFHHPGQHRAALAGQGAPDLADAADRQRRGALRCLDRREERRPPAHDRHDRRRYSSSSARRKTPRSFPPRCSPAARRRKTTKGQGLSRRGDDRDRPRAARHSRRLADAHPGGSHRRT